MLKFISIFKSQSCHVLTKLILNPNSNSIPVYKIFEFQYMFQYQVSILIWTIKFAINKLLFTMFSVNLIKIYKFPLYISLFKPWIPVPIHVKSQLMYKIQQYFCINPNQDSIRNLQISIPIHIYSIQFNSILIPITAN